MILLKIRLPWSPKIYAMQDGGTTLIKRFLVDIMADFQSSKHCIVA